MKFVEYKGLDLPKVAEEVLHYWKENNVFEKSVTSREGKDSLFSMKDHLLQMDCLVFTT